MSRKTEIAGLTCIAPRMGQRRAMTLGRTMARVLGAPALRMIAAIAGSLDAMIEAVGEDLGDTAQMAVLARVVATTLPAEQVDELVELLTSDRVYDLVLDVIHGASVAGHVVSREVPESIDDAWPDPDPWAPYLLAWWIASEYRLFPSPGGSPSAAGLTGEAGAAVSLAG